MNPFPASQLRALAEQFGTPLWVYDEATIVARIAALKQFDVVRFAQKANSNTHLLRLMRAHGVAVDAVSLGEIDRAVAAGYQITPDDPDAIVFTADVLDRATLDRVVADRIPVNAGSIDMLRQLGARSPGHRVWLRLNPGFGHGHSNKTNTGGTHSKHGIWHEEIGEAIAEVQRHELELVGLHMHIGSGVDYKHLQEVCRAMIDLVVKAGVSIHAISAGGGLSIPYRPGEQPVDTAHYFSLWDGARKEIEQRVGHPIKLELEPGRYLVAESGVLLGEVRATKHVGENHFVLLDTGFNELMRPAMYGSYHGMSVIAADGAARPTVESVVAGPLCESGDVFTQDAGGVVLRRELPQAEVGDLLVLHDAGAYGAAMSSNYNTRPLAAEVLVSGDRARLIRRRQTVSELLLLEEQV